jgi:hypothetical protein
VSAETKVSDERLRELRDRLNGNYVYDKTKMSRTEVATICGDLLANRQAIAALKPYLRHMAMCGKNLYPALCDCGLDALLSGATK